MDPVTAYALLSTGGTLLSSALNLRESSKNRQFQEELSGTAHQREVRDLIASGLNPILSANHGASTPGGSQASVEDLGAGFSRGVASALAVKATKAQIEVAESQADQNSAQAQLARTQAADISSTAAAGRYRQISSAADVAQLDARQRTELYDTMVAQAKAELQRSVSSALALDAGRALDKAALTGELNIQKFEKKVGVLSPALRSALEILRVLLQARR